jgi:hypothetical protein
LQNAVLSSLNSNQPSDEGDQILLEVMIENFKDLIIDLGGIINDNFTPNMRSIIKIIEK